MKICKGCGTENADEAKFCKACGRKFVVRVCPNCGAETDEETVFCVNCGARLVARHCPECGAEVADEAAFCMNCGAKLDGAEEFAPARTSESVQSGAAVSYGGGLRISAGKILNIISLSCGIAVAVFSLLFVFMIGFKVSYTAIDSASSASANGIKSYNIYYFFGEIYSEISKSLLPLDYLLDEQLIETYKGTSYAIAFFGYIISAGTMCAVAALALISVISCAKRLKNGNYVNGVKFPLLTYSVFLGGALCIVALLKVKVNYSEYSSFGVSAATVKYLPDGATLAGMIICGLLSLVCAGTAIAAQGKKLFNIKNGVCIGLQLGKTVIAVILAAVVSAWAISFSMDYTVKLSGVASSTGFTNVLNSAIDGFAKCTDNQLSILRTVGIMSCFSYAAMAGTVFCSLICVACGLSSMTECEPQKSVLALGISAAAMAIVHFVLTVCQVSEYRELFKIAVDQGVLTFGFGMPIASLVLAVVAIGIEIALAVIKSYKKRV